MKTVRMFLGFAAFAAVVFVACSDNELKLECDEESGEGCDAAYSSDGDSPNPGVSSGSRPPESSSPSGVSSSTAIAPGVSSSTISASPSSSTTSPTVPSSSSVAAPPVTPSSASPGSNCNYRPSYCGDIAFSDITNLSVTGEAPEGPACIFATAISKLGNENGQGGGIRVNGTKLTGNNNADVGGRCGNTDWGQQTCAAALASVAKVDGGYYIYVPAWAGDFVTTGGTPVCSNPQPQPSSSSVRSSSSTGTVSQSSSARSSSAGTTQSSAGTGTGPSLTCANVPTSGKVGEAITAPAVRCNNSAVTGGTITWSGSPSAPNWNNPAAGTYTNIAASVSVGTCSGLRASCAGTLVVSSSSSAARSSSAATCAGCGSVPNLETLNSGNAKSGTTTRYWDSCKPSCAWSGNAGGGNGNGTAKSCNVNGGTLLDNNAANACQQNGPAYTCMNQAPWRMTDNVSYGFAATTTNGDCGKCYHLQFTGTNAIGKKMIVMVTNIGSDVHQGQFDLMIPGGGVGIFDALSKQISQNGGSNSDLGSQYGGFRTTCGADATCIRNKCNAAFSSAALADLKAGCLWYVDWFSYADNPAIYYKEITCPQDLINRYK